MIRPTFRITSDAGHNVVKHAWNSAIRETEALIRVMAIEENTMYALIDKFSHKEGFAHTYGTRTWQSKATGKIVMFKIEKEK